MNLVRIEIPMPIRTPRLLIKPREVGEGATIAKAVNESLDILKPFMIFAQRAATLDEMEEHCRESIAEFDARSELTLSIYDLSGKVFIGSTGFHRIKWKIPSFEIGYWVHKDFQGLGYISEAVNALTRYAFGQLSAKRVEIRCDARNSRRLKVMSNMGYVQEGILRLSVAAVDGSIADDVVSARYDLAGLPDLEVKW